MEVRNVYFAENSPSIFKNLIPFISPKLCSLSRSFIALIFPDTRLRLRISDGRGSLLTRFALENRICRDPGKLPGGAALKRFSCSEGLLERAPFTVVP